MCRRLPDKCAYRGMEKYCLRVTRWWDDGTRFDLIADLAEGD